MINLGKVLLIIVTVTLIANHVNAQQHKVQLQGKVLNSLNNTPLSNVTISVKGVDQKTSSNEFGDFILSLKTIEGIVLNITMIGYLPQQLELKSRIQEDIIIKLTPINNVLEEVEINTGYQRLPKERSTGSFEIVDAKLFNRQIGTDVISRLDGIMPNILFDKRQGGEDNMIIRGVATLGLTDTKPLIIVDNFPYEGDIRNINPNDVASVTLLKDAAASSIWGAKAGNGVLVITTKKGVFRSPWRVAVTVNSTITEKPDLFYLSKMNSSEYIDVERLLFEKGVFNSRINNVTNYPVLTPVIELLNQHAKGMLLESDLEMQLDVLRSKDVRKDLDSYFYRLGINQQYAASLSGGGEKMNSIFSLGYDRNSSNAVGNDFSRMNLNLQNTFRPLQKMEINVGLRYTKLQQFKNNIGNVYMELGRETYPYADLVDENGQALIVEKDYRVGYLDAVEEKGQLLDWRYRPYEELSIADNKMQSNNIMFTSKVKYDFYKALSGELHYQYEYQSGLDKQHFNEETYFARNLINRFTQVNTNSINHAIPLGGILDRRSFDLRAQAVRGQLNYNQDWSKHTVSVIAGMEIRNIDNMGSTSRIFGYNDDIMSIGTVNYVDRQPIYDNLSSPTAIVSPNQESKTLQRFVSFYGNAAYTFDKRYTFSASARKDASNLFGVETNSKWTPLWSVGGAWHITKESFFNIEALSMLKLRGTYGYSGNVSPNQAAVTTVEYRGVSKLGRYPYAIVQNAPNPMLRWEKIGTINLGLDFALKGNYLTGGLEYYRKTAKDLISTVDADPTTGFNFLVLNSALIRNEGLEISLNGRAALSAVVWTSNFSLSMNKNRVVRYLREPVRASQWVGTGTTVSPIVGQPVYALVSYRWFGLDPQNGNPVASLNGIESIDYNLHQQQATVDDLIFHGSALPEYFGSFRNTMDWRGFSLSANISYRAEYYFRRQTINYSTLLIENAQVGHGDYSKRWQQPGDEIYTSVPSLVYPSDAKRDNFYAYSEATAEKGDHIRLQDVNLSYIFHSNKKRSLFKDIKLTFYARNLGILWRTNKYNLDPDFRQQPLARTWSLGLNANF